MSTAISTKKPVNFDASIISAKTNPEAAVAPAQAQVEANPAGIRALENPSVVQWEPIARKEHGLTNPTALNPMLVSLMELSQPVPRAMTILAIASMIVVRAPQMIVRLTQTAHVHRNAIVHLTLDLVHPVIVHLTTAARARRVVRVVSRANRAVQIRRPATIPTPQDSAVGTCRKG